MTAQKRSETGADQGTESARVPDPNHVELVELLFFAYRNFTGDPDAILERDGLGRAHHRVLHFVARQPGLTVAELLAILGITKQSLARVLRQLIDRGLIRQRAGRDDRRQRHLELTADGRILAENLLKLQSARIGRALEPFEDGDRKAVVRFLAAMLEPDTLERFEALNGPLSGKDRDD